MFGKHICEMKYLGTDDAAAAEFVKAEEITELKGIGTPTASCIKLV
jgi:hypothetical protein